MTPSTPRASWSARPAFDASVMGDRQHEGGLIGELHAHLDGVVGTNASRVRE